MPLVEINFDGIVGPSHNYAGLSFGNIASTTNKGAIAYPRAAARGCDTAPLLVPEARLPRLSPE